MSIACVVCGEWYHAPGRDTLDICPPCFTENFAGAQPPLETFASRQREVLESYVDSAHQMTPRQHQAMRRAAERWAQEED